MKAVSPRIGRHSNGLDIDPQQGETRTQQFTVFAPESFTDGDFDLTVYVNSQDENVERQVEVSIKKATIVLTLDTARIATESDLIADKSGAVRVPIVNEGLLGRTSVIVYLTPPNSAELSQSISVPAGGEGVAVFEGLSFTQGNQRFDYRVEVAGAEATSVEEKLFDDDFSLEYNIETTVDGESIWMTPSSPCWLFSWSTVVSAPHVAVVAPSSDVHFA